MGIRLCFLVLGLFLTCCGGGSGAGESEIPVGDPPPRFVSALEVDAPYLGDSTLFWARSDIFVMRPDLEPLDRWPSEVLAPLDYGVRIIVLLPGDYRGRSNGSTTDGWLYIPQSGTETEPILVVYAPFVGADILAAPHPAERQGQSEALLVAARVIGHSHQVFHGLTFSDGFAPCLLFGATDCAFDRCLWHEVLGQPLRIRFGSSHNLVQRCVFRRFQRETWGSGDTVAIQSSDGACTNNHIVSNVVLNYTDAYQHTDRDGEPYGLAAGTRIDNNFMGFTAEAYLHEDGDVLLCGENAIDMKMGGTAADPVLITNNVFFGTRASKAGCAASGSGGYAVTLHRRATYIHMEGNVFVDNDSGLFLNTMFQDADPALGRIDPHWTIQGNVFTGIRSHADAFPSRTGRVMSGLSPALFRDNSILDSDRLMESEPPPGTGSLEIHDNRVYGPLVLDPRDQPGLEADGNTFAPSGLGERVRHQVPWHDRVLEFLTPPRED